MNDVVIPATVQTQLQAILQQDADADRIALVWPEPLPQAEVCETIAQAECRLVYCPSELAIRERLVNHEPGQARLVILSPFDETALAKDVLARLWKCEPKRISPWRTLQQLLGVSELDPRLTSKPYRWIADVLVSHYDRYGHRLAFGSVLDLPQAWRAVALGLLDFTAEEVDLESLLTWTLSTDAGDRVRHLPEAVMAHLEDWLSPRLGDATPLVKCLWANGHVDDMLGIGLVCDLLYAPHRTATQETFLARGQFTERFLGGEKFAEGVLREFGRACSNFVAKHLATDRARFSGSLTRAEQILASIDLTDIAIESNLLSMAYGFRLDAFAAALNDAVKGKSIEPAHDALASIKRHGLAGVRADQINRATLAVRVCAWLNSDAKVPAGAATSIRNYVREGGFVDWSRARIWVGDEHENLSRVYATLSKALAKRREKENEAFAEHLSEIARGDALGDGLGYVEQCLDRVIIPLAKQSPVLFLVIDGMSQAVYRELADDLLSSHWVEMQREGADGSDCLLSTLPSITRLSRYSLLAGKLGEGVGVDEKKALAAHSGLKAIKVMPELFHKAELQEPGSGGLAPAVRATIAESKHKVVAAVINAVDDQLGSNAQLSVRWNVEQVGLLRQILEAAREAGRVVVLTSDHGHVLDHAMSYRKSTSDAERYKSADEAVETGEVAVQGARVLQPGGKAVLPWSETVRYSKEKMGYHGGASLQEVVIPLGVFRSADNAADLAGWIEVARQAPDWWALDAGGSAVDEQASGGYKGKAARKRPKKKTVDTVTEDMFQQAVPAAPTSHWLDGLLSSPVYRDMKSRAGRVVIGDAQLIALLALLSERGGQAMLPVVGQKLAIPAIRLNGFLAGAQKILNVDGYRVLSVDRATKTVKLDVNTLKTQFEL